MLMDITSPTSKDCRGRKTGSWALLFPLHLAWPDPSTTSGLSCKASLTRPAFNFSLCLPTNPVDGNPKKSDTPKLNMSLASCLRHTSNQRCWSSGIALDWLDGSMGPLNLGNARTKSHTVPFGIEKRPVTTHDKGSRTTGGRSTGHAKNHRDHNPGGTRNVCFASVAEGACERYHKNRATVSAIHGVVMVPRHLARLKTEGNIQIPPTVSSGRPRLVADNNQRFNITRKTVCPSGR